MSNEQQQTTPPVRTVEAWPETRQLMEALDKELTGHVLAFCECPPEWLSPAQQLIRHGWIERARELQKADRAKISQADPQNCPDCTYAVQDKGKFVELASGVFTLGHAANCMATGETENMPRTLAYRCAHCGGSNTSRGPTVDLTAADVEAERTLGTIVYCHECLGGNKSVKGITLYVETDDSCCATQIEAKPISETQARHLVLDADQGDVFYPDRQSRRAATTVGVQQ